MKKSGLTHSAVFNDEHFALNYARKHQSMAVKFSREYAKKLTERGFTGGRILDDGCGFGRTAVNLAASFPESQVYGIDLSDILLDLARQSASAEHLADRVTFTKADVLAIPFEDRYFDAVLNVNMLHLVNDPVKMLNEIQRVTKPGGAIFIADLKRSWLGLLEAEIKSAWTPEEAKEFFSKSKIRPGTFSTDMLWWRFEA